MLPRSLMVLINDSNGVSNSVPKGVKLHPRKQIAPLVESFGPFMGVILDISDYIPNCVT